MPTSTRCPDCGAMRPNQVLSGPCPACLMRLALNGPNLSLTDNGPGAAAELPRGVLETIAQSIGPVPRVLLRDTAPGEDPSPIIKPQGDHATDPSVRYRIDGEIARGGMGSVLKGRDPDLGRDVALKVLREDHRDDPDMIRRFVEEAQIGGQLQHPGIVPIYELGTFSDRRPFFSMKLVKGQTLAQILQDRKENADDLPRFLSTFEAVCQTVAYAHARGVIHRDLKPSNVMVGSFGEVQVMDWGLAKVLPRGGVVDDAQAGRIDRQETVIATARSGDDSGAQLSRAGSVMGTPSYMSPEQARGEIDRIDERADVFALGSMLCELLTGQPAFLGRSSGEIQRKAALGDLADATGRLDGCGADLELVALARDCLAREPEDRPRTAGDVASRITTYLSGVQEKLRRAELDKVEERARRRLTTVVAGSVILIGLVSGAGFFRSLEQKAQRLAKTAQAVDEALADASRLRGEARAAPPGDMERWAEAISAARRAEGFLAQGEADAPMRGRVAVLISQLKAEQDAAAALARRVQIDRTLLTDLEMIRGNRAEHDDPKRTDSEYAEAFRKAGLDLDATDPDAAGKWIAVRSQPVELAAYLDDWSFVRISAGLPEAAWRRLVAAARVADPDPWRGALRSRAGSKDPAALAECRRLADDAASLEEQPPASLVLLAGQLTRTYDDQDRACRLLREATRRHPDDFWLHMTLADSYAGYIEFTQPEEAIRHLTAAIALRPRSAIARWQLGNVLTQQYKLDEAIAEYREAIRVQPDQAKPYGGLASALIRLGQHDEAISQLRKALEIDPHSAKAHEGKAEILMQQGKPEEADAELREAIRLQPDSAYLRYVVADHLRQRGLLEEAAAECREAIRISPDFADTHSLLGEILEKQGKSDEALAAHHKSIQLRTPSFDTYDRFRDFMTRRGKLDEVVAVFRESVRTRPGDASRHIHIAEVLKDQGKSDEALAEVRETLRLKPQSVWVLGRLESMLAELGKPEDLVNLQEYSMERARKLFGPASPGTASARASLGLTLIKRGQWSEAERILRECLAIREKSEPDAWTTFNARSLLGGSLLGQKKFAEAEPMIITGYEGIKARVGKGPPGSEYRLAEAAERVHQLYEAWGKKDKDVEWEARLRPRTVAEKLAFIRVYHDKGEHAAAVRHATDTLAADPKLLEDRAASDYRYNAACSAALAAAGRGKDAPQQDDARARLRGQALAWLKEERDARAKLLGGDAKARAQVVMDLRHWKIDPDLSAVRDSDALSKLPDPEHKAWQALWADVDSLLARAQDHSR